MLLFSDNQKTLCSLFQKFHPTATSETAKLSNKLIEHSSDAVGEIPEKVFKPRMPAKFHQSVRAT